jgi:hypothetical protein
MRWDRLFDDLETQLEAAADDELDAQVADRTRRELAATSFEGRLRGASGRVVELLATGAGVIAGEIRRVGPGWLLLNVAGAPPAVVALRFVVAARDLPLAAREASHDATASEQIGLAPVLRVLMRDRTVTAVVLADGTVLTGTIDRVGTDYLDLAEHPLDESRRPSAIRGIRTLPLSAVAALRPRLE